MSAAYIFMTACTFALGLLSFYLHIQWCESLLANKRLRKENNALRAELGRTRLIRGMDADLPAMLRRQAS